MNRMDELINELREEMGNLSIQYEIIQSLQAENVMEQDKIRQQNINIKDRIAELKASQLKVDTQRKDLDEREKQIVIKEKSQITSNRLLDEKLLDFRKKTVDLADKEKRLQKDTEEYKAKKALVDQQSLINKKLEETEALRKKKIKIKEEQVDNELARLREMQV